MKCIRCGETATHYIAGTGHLCAVHAAERDAVRP